MAEECSPLLSTLLEADAVEEIHLMSVSPNSEPNETEVKTIVVNNFEERISNETEVKTVAVYEDRDEVVTSDTTPLPPGKEYHLFMSYSSEDRDDANTIRQHLEERFYLKCLYYERDFQIGKNIDENITDGLQKSVKALILLSPFYIQSHYCVTEAREACKLSFTDMENHNVIPVLLRPLPKDLPPFLNSYVYIDAQREMDVAGKIYEAFNQPGFLDPLQMSKSGLQCNGTLLFRKVGSRAKYLDHGLVYRFSPLEPYEEEKISQNGMDQDACRNHYNTITKALNNKFLFQNYPVFSSVKWRCLLLCILTTAFCFIWMASYILSATYGSPLKDSNYAMINFIVGLPLLGFICPFGLLIIYGCRRKLSTNIHHLILRHNLRFFRLSKCLVYFDQSTLTKPTLHVFRYDIADCEDFLLTALSKYREDTLHGDCSNNKEILKELIHQKLAELQSTQALIKWTLLRESSVNRHRTSNNRACICEMLEDHVNKTYGPVVIQV
uniref:TIR domain-containing protein n=1 Tax=Magallana gigas TaxID=29159 RepID=A0A8W8J7P4_MAGGI|nr:uncharacterized protein LOC105322450 isoform X1 [Crassostrea gigas]